MQAKPDSGAVGAQTRRDVSMRPPWGPGTGIAYLERGLGFARLKEQLGLSRLREWATGMAAALVITLISTCGQVLSAGNRHAVYIKVNICNVVGCSSFHFHMEGDFGSDSHMMHDLFSCSKSVHWSYLPHPKSFLTSM